LEETVPFEPTPGSIQKLTAGLAKGCEKSFREFHALYFDRLYQFLLVVARGNDSEARESLQQTLLRVAKYARPFEAEEAFWSWLKVVARTAARDAGRKQHRYREMLQRFFSLRDHENNPASPEPDISLLLTECLEELDTGQRKLLDARYFQGASLRDLAVRENASEKAMESRLARIRTELRQRILKKLKP